MARAIIFWPVASESALVVGRTYDIVLARHSSMLVADGALTGQHAHADRHGKRRLAGAFVVFHGKRNNGDVDSWGACQMLTFANGVSGYYVNIEHRRWSRSGVFPISRPPVRCLARDAEFGAEQRPGAHNARRDVEHAAASKGRLGVADGLQAHAV